MWLLFSEWTEQWPINCSVGSDFFRRQSLKYNSYQFSHQESSMGSQGNRISWEDTNTFQFLVGSKEWLTQFVISLAVKQKNGKTVETASDFIFLGSKITADGDCSHEIKRRLFLGRKVMTNLDSKLKSRDITLPTKLRLVKAMVFPVVMYRCGRRQWQPTPVLLPGKSHGWRSLVGCSPWGC